MQILPAHFHAPQLAQRRTYWSLMRPLTKEPAPRETRAAGPVDYLVLLREFTRLVRIRRSFSARSR